MDSQYCSYFFFFFFWGGGGGGGGRGDGERHIFSFMVCLQQCIKGAMER